MLQEYYVILTALRNEGEFMNSKVSLAILGFYLAGVNYLISGYQMPAVVCFLIALFIETEMNIGKSWKQQMITFLFALIVNMAIFCCGLGIINEKLGFLILKLIIFQSLIEGKLLMRLFKSKEESILILKISSFFYLIFCFLIIIVPNGFLDYFLYANMKGNGALQLFLLCCEIFVPLILVALNGVLYNELTIKKEPKHYFGSIK